MENWFLKHSKAYQREFVVLYSHWKYHFSTTFFGFAGMGIFPLPAGSTVCIGNRVMHMNWWYVQVETATRIGFWVNKKFSSFYNENYDICYEYLRLLRLRIMVVIGIVTLVIFCLQLIHSFRGISFRYSPAQKHLIFGKKRTKKKWINGKDGYNSGVCGEHGNFPLSRKRNIVV